MCIFGGGGSSPPPPSPSVPPRQMNMQAAPSSAEASGRTRSASDSVETSRRGRQVLKIPLLRGAGSGVQIPT